MMFFGSSRVKEAPVGRNETMIFTLGLRDLSAERYFRSPEQEKDLMSFTVKQTNELTLFAGNEGKVVLHGDVRVDDVRTETRVQIVRTEVVLDAVVADQALVRRRVCRTFCFRS